MPQSKRLKTDLLQRYLKRTCPVTQSPNESRPSLRGSQGLTTQIVTQITINPADFLNGWR